MKSEKLINAFDRIAQIMKDLCENFHAEFFLIHRNDKFICKPELKQNSYYYFLEIHNGKTYVMELFNAFKRS